MTKSDLIERLTSAQDRLDGQVVDEAVRCILEQLAVSLEQGTRIEVRGFGSFSLHYREPRMGRNPKNGEAVQLEGKFVPHFKPGKVLRERVNLL